jgi:hypothetical protein
MFVDTASVQRRLDPDAFARWAATRTVFLPSEMRELGELRRTVASALRDAGFSVVVFEDLGGHDEDAQRAYLDGVARSDIYVGVVADRYGTMLATGRSPTREEYLQARRRGKRISVWLQRDASGRQGHAADFAHRDVTPSQPRATDGDRAAPENRELPAAHPTASLLPRWPPAAPGWWDFGAPRRS